MAESNPLTTTEAQTDDLRETIRRLGDNIKSPHGKGYRRDDVQQLSPIKCGDMSAEDGIYSGTVNFLMSTTMAPQAFGNVWLYSWGDALEKDTTYLAQRYGDHTVEAGDGASGSRPVYVCQKAGGISTIIGYTLFDGVDGDTCPLSDTPPKYWLSTTMSYDGCLSADCEDETVESCNLVWLTPLYQSGFTGGLAETTLLTGWPYVGIPTGTSKTFTVDTLDGPADEDDNPTSNPQGFNLPVYFVALMPTFASCSEGTQSVIIGPY